METLKELTQEEKDIIIRALNFYIVDNGIRMVNFDKDDLKLRRELEMACSIVDKLVD